MVSGRFHRSRIQQTQEQSWKKSQTALAGKATGKVVAEVNEQSKGSSRKNIFFSSLCKQYSKERKSGKNTGKMGKEEILIFPLRFFIFFLKGK